MNEQVGWRAFADRFKAEAPRYAHLLPELPRLVHAALKRPPASDSAALLALLAEQRRTNRLLQGLLWGIVGFVGGALLVRAFSVMTASGG
jgi:ubiquinone biosynthesis protein